MLLAAGFILAQMVNMWIVSGPILFFWLLSVILIAISGDWETTLRIVAGGARRNRFAVLLGSAPRRAAWARARSQAERAVGVARHLL